MDDCPFRVSEDVDNKNEKNWEKPDKNSILSLFNNARQILPNGTTITAFTGWMSGIFVGKIGKAAMVSIGTSLLLLQIARAKGYVKINEAGVKELVAFTSAADGKWTKRWLENLVDFVARPHALAYCFTAGFLLGLWCS